MRTPMNRELSVRLADMHRLRLGSLLLLAAWPALATQAQGGGAASWYDAAYRAVLHPEQGTIDVELNLSGEKLPSSVTLRIDAQHYKGFTSTDPLQVGTTHVTWHPQGKKSRLRYQFVVNHERSPQHYDSLMRPDWAVFRGDKMVPRVSVKARRGLHARASIEFVLPPQWSIATAYAPQSDAPSGAARFEFDDPQRRFDRPGGWMLAGRIGSRGEKIGHVRAIVAAPVGENARRQDMLAFLNWNLPRLLEVFTDFPDRVLIVTAGDPMWRGGLSGPGSLFLHSERPLISENRTSSLLHELVHIALGIRADGESDWIVEGLAEFYSLETLRRSGGISEHRYKQAIAGLEKWARRSATVFAKSSTGPTTARAVVTLRAVDAEIRSVTNGKASLDEVARRLAAERGTVSLVRLQEVAQAVAGRPLRSLQREQLMKPLAAPAP
jgi:predicted metalloprotease with PDZ domain